LKKRAGEFVDDLRNRLAFFEEMGAGFVPAGAGRGAEGIPPSGGSGTKTLSSAAERELREFTKGHPTNCDCRMCDAWQATFRATCDVPRPGSEIHDVVGPERAPLEDSASAEEA